MKSFMKKTIGIIAITSALVLTLCACDNVAEQSGVSPSPSVKPTATVAPSATATASPSSSPSPSASAKTSVSESPKPSESPKAKNSKAIEDDSKARAAEIKDIKELIKDELYDDANMAIKAILTKDLSDEQKNEVMELKQQVNAKLGKQ
ncbi:MAG: hypothetical protein RR145_04340 [Oscillospiraceae bacterium]